MDCFDKLSLQAIAVTHSVTLRTIRWNALTGWARPQVRGFQSYHETICVEEVNLARPLLNYTTKIPANQTASEIMSILVKKGATDIVTHYGPAGMATGLKWHMETANGTMGFSLPINADAVFHITDPGPGKKD